MVTDVSDPSLARDIYAFKSLVNLEVVRRYQLGLIFGDDELSSFHLNLNCSWYVPMNIDSKVKSALLNRMNRDIESGKAQPIYTEDKPDLTTFSDNDINHFEYYMINDDSFQPCIVKYMRMYDGRLKLCVYLLHSQAIPDESHPFEYDFHKEEF